MRFTARQATTLLICFGILLRGVLAGYTGLGVDESYAAAMARTPELSYFDHPPLHFWLIWLASHMGGSESAAVLRWPFILLFAGTTWLMYRLGGQLFGEWAGFYAALLLNVSAVFGLSTGTWLLPDGPLLFFMLAAVTVLALLFFGPPVERTLPYWLAAGIFTGMGLLSKYHALFVAAGCFLYLLTSRHRRRLLRTVSPYAAFMAALLVFLPVLLWNQTHDWASFLFQGGRSAASGFYPQRLLGNIAGQAVWILPWIWLPLIWSLGKAMLRGPAFQASLAFQDRSWFLACLAIGPVALFTAAVLWGGQGLFHWQAPGYLMAYPLLGRAVHGWMAKSRQQVRLWLKASVALFLFLVITLATHASNGWIKQLAPQWFAAGDPTLEMLDWRDLNEYLRHNRLADGETGFILATHWIDAGKIDYALGGRLPVLCLSAQPHHFAFRYDPAAFRGKDALIIGRPQMLKNSDAYTPYFSSLERVGNVTLDRGGKPELELVIWRARNFSGDFPLPYGIKTLPNTALEVSP